MHVDDDITLSYQLLFMYVRFASFTFCSQKSPPRGLSTGRDEDSSVKMFPTATPAGKYQC